MLHDSSGFAVKIRTIGVVKEDFTIESNITCINLLGEVYLASDNLLKRIFTNGNIKIGHLKVRPSVPVSLDAKTLCSRHFAILAMTGAGKSNTVATLSEELYKIAKGKINIVIIDPHGEYTEMKSNNEINILKPVLDPSQFNPEQIPSLLKLNGNATNQSSLLIRAASTINYEIHKNKDYAFGENYLIKLEEKLREWADAIKSGNRTIKYYDGRKITSDELKKNDIDTINKVIKRINDYIIKNSKLLGDHKGMFSIRNDKINILDLSSLSEWKMIPIVAEFMKKTLNERIKAVSGQNVYLNVFETPTLVIIEEAHIFAARDANGMKKEALQWISRIAKEGRKFGVGMGIISQRPKELNSTVLSQANTKIILKIVEPADQRYVQESSENISNDLLKDMPRLSTGEAVIVGSSLQIPATVKINRYNGKLGGVDGFECLKNI